MVKKLKFKAVVSLVIGSQIGSGVFLLPSSLSALGSLSLLGWAVSGIGAILLALVFAQLSMRVSKGGGPHVYVEEAFGQRAAFFTAWTYWLVSWVSSIAVIIAAVGYLAPFLNIESRWTILAWEMGIISAVTALNIRSTSGAGSFEILLTLLKCIPLVFIPAIGLFFFKADHFSFVPAANQTWMATLNSACLMTFWGFIGLETATTSASIIDNPTRTIPRAVVVGTTLVALIYFVSSLGVMGVVPPTVLAQTQAPYAEAARLIFGGGWQVPVGLIAFTACIGTLNAWVLTSGQIAAQAAKEGLFPPFFAKTNRAGSPYASLSIVLVCTLCLLCLTVTPDILTQLNEIIDVSVTTFLFIYLACAFSLIKTLAKTKRKCGASPGLLGNEAQERLSSRSRAMYMASALSAAAFCVWMLLFISWTKLLLSSLFALSGVPVYLWNKRRVVLDR